MSLAFSLALLLASIAYGGYGLATLSLTDSLGRPGPGFFPLLIALGLVACTAILTVREWRVRAAVRDAPAVAETAAPPARDTSAAHLRDTLVATGLILLLLASLVPLGAVASTVLFCLVWLAWFNRGRALFNLGYALLFPAAVYLLFEVLLRAGLPSGWLLE